MKKILLGVFTMAIAGVCFAETFDIYKYKELQTIARETKTAAAQKNVKDYVMNSALSGEAAGDYVQLLAILPLEFSKAKVIPTVEQIDAKVNEKFTAADVSASRKASLRATLYRIYRYPDALVALSKQFAGQIDNSEVFEKQAAVIYINQKKYDKAMEICNRLQDTEEIVFRIYVAKKDKENVWLIGKKIFTDNYVSGASSAMNYIKNMFNFKPESVKDEQVAEFLKYLGDKYPTPGTDFETWKGFMGFIGYKYKTITGSDLFKDSEESKTTGK